MNLPDKALLDYFAHCPSCDSKVDVAPGTTVLICGNCDLEMHFSPVTSAAALIADRHGNVLFIKRKKEPHKGKLGLPGGFVNPGESLEDALHREVWEEIGIVMDSWSYLGGWPNKYSYQSVVYSVTDIYFVARVEDFDAVKICPKEVEEIQVAHPNTIHLDEFAFPSLKTAVTEYLKLYYK